MTVRVAFAAGSHWASPADWEDRLDRILPHADRFITTETTPRQWSAFDRPGWGRARTGEIAILWHTSHSRRRSRLRNVTLSRIAYYTGKGGRRHVPAARVTLQELGQRRRDDVWGIHAPASVQHGDQWSNKGPRVAAHKAGTRRLRRRTARARARGRRIVVGIDTNLDQRRPVWRAHMIAATGLDNCWSSTNLPPTGTHRGNRLIDAILAAGFVVEHTEVLPEPAGSPFDHDVVIVTIR